MGAGNIELFPIFQLTIRLNRITVLAVCSFRMSSICESGEDDTWAIRPLPYDIFQVSEVTMPDGASWLGTEDHSKWVT